MYGYLNRAGGQRKVNPAAAELPRTSTEKIPPMIYALHMHRPRDLLDSQGADREERDDCALEALSASSLPGQAGVKAH